MADAEANNYCERSVSPKEFRLDNIPNHTSEPMQPNDLESRVFLEIHKIYFLTLKLH